MWATRIVAIPNWYYHLSGMLKRQYDLTMRTAPGEVHRYRCRDVLNILDDAGRVGHRQQRTAALVVTNLGLAHDGNPRLRWSYDHFSYEVERNRIEDAYALPAGVECILFGASEEAIPLKDSIEFDSVPEDPDSYFPAVEAFGLSLTSTVAFMTVELILHTRAFWIMATRSHGGIDQLRMLGDWAIMPWSGKVYRMRYGDMYDATMRRADSTLRFDGLTIRHAHDTALLSCHTPYSIGNPGFGPGQSDLVGHLWVDLDTGTLTAGEARQTNFLSRVRLPDGSPSSMRIRFESTVELLED